MWSNRHLVSGVTVRQSIKSTDLAMGLGLVTTAVAAPAWPTANLAIYIPFTIEEVVTIKRILVYNGGVVSGNVDVGIYDESGTRLVSSGSTAQAGTSQAQVFNIADTQLAIGRYYLAIVVDNITATVGRLETGVLPLNIMSGCKEETSAFPLPATATFAESATRDFVPVITATLET